MKRFACIFLTQIFLCVSVSSAECPAVPTIEFDRSNIEDDTVYVEEDKSSFPFPKFSLSYYSGVDTVSFGEVHASAWDPSSESVWYDWTDGDGGVFSKTSLSRVVTNSRVISFHGRVHDCNKNLIGSFKQVFFGVSESAVNGVGAELSLYNPDGSELLSTSCHGSQCPTYEFVRYGDEGYSRLFNMNTTGNGRSFTLKDNFSDVDMRLIVAVASLLKVRL